MSAIRKTLAAKKVSFLLVFLLLFGQSTRAGIPTIDIAGLVQGIITAIESVSQTLNQIEQYRTQLQQYENQLTNSLTLSSWQWDNARTTMNQLRGAMDTLSGYKTRLGSLQNYLDKFHDLEYYRSHGCFQGSGCSQAQLNEIKDKALLAFESQKKANDASFKALDKQQDTLESDADNLEIIQSRAQGATGQLQAIQYANQLASHQANQLMQIRGMLLSQQNAAQTAAQAALDKQAYEKASEDLLRTKNFSSSPAKTW